MLSAVIPSVHSYAALRLAPQLLHQRYVHPGPLVLRTAPLNSPTPTADRDRTVSRRSEPSSRTTLIGEQPNPWDLLQPQDVMSRHRSEEHTSELQSQSNLVCRLLLEKKNSNLHLSETSPSTSNHRAHLLPRCRGVARVNPSFTLSYLKRDGHSPRRARRYFTAIIRLA